MKKNDERELLLYVIQNDLCEDIHTTSWEELSSGNINYIYRITNEKTNKSVILKFASNETRVRPDGFLSPRRNEHEAGVLQWYSKVVPECVPHVLKVNKKKHYFLMEDIRGATTLKNALISGAWHENMAETLVFFIVDSTFPLLDMVRRDRQIDRPCSRSFSNDLAHITEELVFTAPYYDLKNKNIYTSGNEEYIKEKLANDELKEILAYLKEKFNTYKQSLIHGDLHTGSILVKTDETEVLSTHSGLMDMAVIDPEFAFYGPIAYDVGNILAHIYFAELYRVFHAKNELSSSICLSNYQEQIEKFILFFNFYGTKTLKNLIQDPIYSCESYLHHYIGKIIDDAFRYAGCEIIRRVVGSAKTLELEMVQDKKVKLPLERTLIDVGVKFILDGQQGAFN